MKSCLSRSQFLGSVALGTLFTLLLNAPAMSQTENQSGNKTESNLEVATFGGGCFWCVESVFEQVKGVKSVVSGYEGGRVKNPTYKQVCTGNTGHAEVCRVEYDPKEVSFEKLLQIFWKVHDPTTLNRQGPDEGTQYRSVIFYHTEEQREIAQKYKKKLNELKAFRSPVVTEISETSEFYPAEEYHQDYFAKNPRDAYCNYNIPPKLEKFRQAFGDMVKDN
jgi:peptide-methionine (S)-S-oxide reductase